MGEECAMLEVSKKKEEKSDDFELSLELSIGGGKYGKSENSRGKTTRENIVEGPNNNNNNIKFGISSRSAVDLQKRKEIQALRRQEARKKREDRKKSRIGLLEDNNQEKRGIRENYGFLEDQIMKKENIFNYDDDDDDDDDELSLSLFTEKKKKKNIINIIPSSQQQQQQIEIRECLLYPKVQYGFAYPYCGDVPPVTVPSNWAAAGEGERETVSISNRSLEQSSSDYQSTSHKGGSNSDTGSHSSPSCPNQYHSISKNEFDQHFESNDSSCQTEPDRHFGGSPTIVAPSSNMPHLSWGPLPDKPKIVPDTHFINQTNNTCSTSDNLAQTSGGCGGGGLNDKPVKPAVHMPCVSTTGNGPNGRTIRGFLYKYTKTEVSIVCVCHGSSFSPAEFVEHAGGVDVSHPLRHITIVRSDFG